MRPLEEIVILIDETPVAAVVVGAIETRVLRLDERVHPIGIASGDLHGDLAHCLARKAVRETAPRGAAVLRLIDATAAAPAFHAPGMDDELPHPGDEDIGIMRVERDVGGTGRVIDEEHSLPAHAAIT